MHFRSKHVCIIEKNIYCIYVLQWIDPIEFLKSTLEMFNIEDFVETTTSNAAGTLWTCEISFRIPSRSPSLDMELIERKGKKCIGPIYAKRDTVHLCLVALRCLGVELHDFSDLKIEAWRAQQPVAHVAESFAQRNVMDVVKCPQYFFINLVGFQLFFSSFF